MTTSLEERLFTAERLLAGLVRERAGVATEDDLRLLHNAGVAFGRMVAAPPPPPPPAPAAARAPFPWPSPEPSRQPAAPRRFPDMVDHAGDDAYDDDLVQGPRRRERVAMPPGVERWVAEKMNATPGDWIARAGMALLLFGIAFLCKYSIDRGWITPALRVSAGGVAGAVLIGLGVRTHRGARPFSALFLGGGIAAWYIATYAAYAMYHLVPFPVAFAQMAATTLAAFGLALWSGVETLAVVAALGGVATPFVLPTEHPSVPGFVAYLLCVLGWTSGIYLGRRWRTSFAVGVVGTWVALGTALDALPAGALSSARIALTVGFSAVLLAGWALFLLPRVMPARFRPSAGEQAAHAWWGRALQLPAERVAVAEGYLAVAVPFLVVWPSLCVVWNLADRSGGYLGVGVVWVTMFTFAALRTRLPALARAHAFAGAAAGAASLALVSRTVPETVVGLAVYGCLLHAWARREPLGRPVRLLAHVVMALAAVAVAPSLLTPANTTVRVALLAVAVCAYAAAREQVSGVGRQTRDAYRLGGHGVVALLLWALCWPLPHAGAWFTVCLAAFAVALCWLERQPEGGAVWSGRPVDGAAAVALHAAALITVWGFCGVFGAGEVAWFNPRAAAELALVGSLAAGALLAGPGRRRAWLAGTGYALWLPTALDQFHGVNAGAALTTGVWAATGLALLLAALRLHAQGGVRVALGTLALVCAKLFLVDLADLDPIWRILLFMGVGSAFLAVSYYVRTAWLSDSGTQADPPVGVSLAGP